MSDNWIIVIPSAVRRRVGVFLMAGLLAMGWAGCADEKNSTVAASKPLAPPSFKDPVAPTIPEPNTNPTTNVMYPQQSSFPTVEIVPSSPGGGVNPNPIINAP